MSFSLFLPWTRHYNYNYRYRLGCESMQALRSLLYEGNGYAKAKVVVFAKTALQQTYIYQEHEMVEKYNR